MQIQITCRHTKMTPTLRGFVEQRLSKLERFATVREAHVILTSQKYLHTAEILLKTRKKELMAREESNDLVLSVDRSIDRLERQLKKLREKTSSRILRDGTHPNGGEPEGAVRSAARAAMGTRTATETEEATPPARRGKTLAGKRAVRAGKTPGRRAPRAALELAQVEEMDDGESNARPRIVPARGPGKPLSVEEAAEVLLQNGQEFVAFVNAATDQMNVLYRRSDGDLGWIAPRQTSPRR